MKIAITKWGDRISPVFESARMLLITEAHKGEVVNSAIENLPVGQVGRTVDLLVDLKVEVLICGALSAWSTVLLETRGIEVVHFVAGDVEVILDLYLKGNDLAGYAMPGCPCGRRYRVGAVCRKRRT